VIFIAPSLPATLRPLLGREFFLSPMATLLGVGEAPYPLSSDDLFISGHTHVAKLIHLPEEPITLNPGSLSSPRDNSPPSYALLSSDEIVIKNLLDGSPLASLSLTKLSQS
jgi:hypothetical protein